MKRLVFKNMGMAVLLGLGLLPLLWFRPGYNALAGFDFAVYFDPVGVLSKCRYLWSDLMAGGYDISHEVSSAPYYLLFSLPMLAGSSLYGAEKFVFCVLFLLQGVSMSYMLNALFEKSPERGAIALTGAVIYSLSFTVMAHFGRGNLMALLTYGLLPFLIGMLHKGFKSEGSTNKYVAGIALLSIPIAATKGHPADFVVLSAVAAFFTLFQAFLSGRGAVRIVSFAAKSLAASVLVNLWWIAPNIHYMSDFGLTRADLVKEGFYNLETLNYYSSGKSILRTLLNNSLDLWFDIPGDAALNPSVYASPLFVAAGLLTPLAGAMALLRRRTDANMIFFSMLFLGAVFMAKGNHPPFGGVFEKLYMNVPGFFLFRAPYRVFSSLIAFSLAPLAALLAGSFAWRFFNHREPGELFRLYKGAPTNVVKATALFVFIAAAALYSWPVFTGSHLREKGTLREPGVFHSMPEDYSLAGEWLKKAGNGSKLYIPYEVYDANAKWGYSGPDPSYELIYAPKVVARPNGTVYLRYQKPIERLNEVVRDLSYGDLKKVLAFHNIRYVMENRHLSPWVLDDPNFNEYLESLLKENGFNNVKKIGALSFYENTDYPGRVYSAPRAYILSGDERALPALSVAGYLERPFLVMAKDAHLDELAASLKSFDGVIFYNSNLIDLMCESAKARFGATEKGDGFAFKARSGTVHEVYARGNSEVTAVVDGKPLENAQNNENGFSWKSLGEFRAGGEEHTLIVNGPGAEGVVVVPKGLLEGVRKAFGEAGSSEDFETAFLFDKNLENKVEISLERSYEAMTLSPKEFRRVEEDALGGVRWSFDREGLTYSANVDADLGKYPRLAVDAVDKKNLSGITLFFSVDKKDGLERLDLGSSVFGPENETDIGATLKKRFPDASVFTLKSVRAVYSSPQKNKVPGLRLSGSFGVEKYCPPGKAALRVGEIDIEDGRCDEWSSHAPLMPGRYAVEGPGSGRMPVLFLRKRAASEKDASKISYARLDPARYLILAEAEKDTRLIFGDSYNAGWTLKDENKSYKPIKVNGYANGFLADGKKKEFQLEYSPQRLFDLSKLISAVSLAAVAALGIYTIKGASKN